MKLTNEYFTARREAIAWLKNPPHKRKYAEGLVIMEKSGYKRNVLKMLIQKGERDWTKEKLSACMRELVQVYYNPNDPRFDDAYDVDAVNNASEQVMALPEIKTIESKSKEKPLPKVIQILLQNFGKAYRERAKLVRLRSELGESNDAAVMDKRREYNDEIDSLSAYMDKLHAMKEEYNTKGVIPTEQDIEQPASRTPETPAAKDMSGMTGPELIARRKTVTDQIRRKQNMLRYQTESKLEKENPMPECPKRVKITKKIEKLQEEKTLLEYELAKRI